MKNIIILFILGLITLAGSLSGQEYVPECDYSLNIGDWRVSKQPISFDMSASLTHMLGSAYLANSFDNSMPWWQADIATLSLGLLWEVKDGLVPWEKGVYGGEGFSVNDFKMDLLGVAINRFLPIMLEKTFSAVQSFDQSNLSLGFSGESYPKLMLSMGM